MEIFKGGENVGGGGVGRGGKFSSGWVVGEPELKWVVGGGRGG